MEEEKKELQNTEESTTEDKKPAKKKGGKIALYILLVLAAVLVGALVSWRVLDAMGKKALYGDQEDAAPTLVSASDAPEDADAGDTANAEAVPENWKEGWVRYNGKIYEYKSNILTFLFMGIDDDNYVSKKKGYRMGGQADALFLLVMDPDEKEISIVAINRNTMTGFDTFDADGNFDYRGYGQICLAYEYGDGMETSCENEENAVRDLFYSLPIHGYVSINMGAITTINDAVGGVTVPQMTYENNEIVYGEEETLHGKDAYAYVRNRGEAFGASAYRLEKQKVYLKALMNKTLSAVKEDPTTIVNLYKAITPYMVTDIDLSEVTYLADNMAGYHFNTDLYSLSGETSLGEDGYEEFHADEDALYDLMIKAFYKEVQE